MLSRFEALAVIWVLSTVLLFVVILTDDRWEATTERIILAVGRSVLLGFGSVAIPAVVVLGMDAITPLTTIRGQTLPGHVGDAIAVAAAATGLYMVYLSRYQQSTADDDILSASGRRTLVRIFGVGLSAAALAAGFL